jgi:hypothetical protein
MEDTFNFDSEKLPQLTVDLLFEVLARLHVHSDILAAMIIRETGQELDEVRKQIHADKDMYRKELLAAYWAKMGPDLGGDL